MHNYAARTSDCKRGNKFFSSVEHNSMESNNSQRPQTAKEKLPTYDAHYDAVLLLQKDQRHSFVEVNEISFFFCISMNALPLPEDNSI